MQRIYRVINTKTAARCLVRASSQAQAIRYAVADDYKAAVAGQEEIVEMLLAGAMAGDAGAELQLDIEPDKEPA